MVDIDGVISLFGGPAIDSADKLPGSFHSIDGIPHFLSAAAAAHLLELAISFDLVWASGWEEKADEHLPRLLGLPAGLPHLSFERSVGRSNAHWKLDAIDRYAGARPLAWIDDALDGACHSWAGARRAPTLLVQTEPTRGLTGKEAALLSRWASSLAEI
jgi:HAD domain in Swiss Army Knife RNA repair proteins